MKRNYEPKPLFVERMTELLGEKEFKEYYKKSMGEPLRSIRVNTLKISPDNLMKRLKENSWVVEQPFEEFPEIIIIKGKYVNENTNNKTREIINLEPGELGRSLEHLLGYYYVQDISSMLPAIALNPKENEVIIDLCASPGSKTTQMAMKMKNLGVLIANDIVLGRIKILASNLERCGVTNTIITKENALFLCRRLSDEKFHADKILIDAPCSGEGTIIDNKKTLLMWNRKNIANLSKKQKKILQEAINLLDSGGEIVYSTCTHAPEENEEVIDHILKENKNIKLLRIENIPKELKTREGVTEWQDKKYSNEVKKCVRVYPQDNQTEGFFISKLRKVK